MKSTSTTLLLVLYLLSLFGWILGVVYIPQRTEMTYTNEKYVYNGSSSISRYGRKSTYYFNIQAGIYHTWGDNITVHLIFYEYQQNQYKRSFFEVHMKMCDLFQRDPYFGKVFTRILDKYQITCPIQRGMYAFYNITLPTEHMPNVLSFEKGKVEVTFRQLPTNDIIGTVYTTFMIKEK